MAIVDVTGYRFLLAADAISLFTQIEEMISAEATHGEESETRIYVLGGGNPHVAGGANTDEYRLAGLYDTGAAGQNLLRTARDTEDTVVIRVMPEGSGEAGYQQECRVTQYTEGAEAGAPGNYVRCSFSLRAISARLFSDAEGVFAGDLL